MSAIQKIQFFRDIVDTNSYKEHDNMIVDLFTASIVVQIHDALNDENREKLLSLSIEEICFFSLQLANNL